VARSGPPFIPQSTATVSIPSVLFWKTIVFQFD
jgi:hypothetical protein